MSTNRYPLNNEDVNRGSDRITAFFANQNDAYRALTELKQHGFTNDQIGLAALDDNQSGVASFRSGEEIDSNVADAHNAEFHGPTPGESRHRSFWQDIKDFFSGETHDDATDFQTSTSGLNWTDERSRFYSQGLESGGCILTVRNANEDARRILERCGGDLRESGFELRPSTTYAGEGLGNADTVSRSIDRSTLEAGTRAGTNTGEFRDNQFRDEQRRIQLRGELLRAHKERVERGEVRLRKEVVTENQTLNVPVTREELVIERGQPTNRTASGEIGTDSEIRVPLSEERVIPEKQSVVNEEVRVGKRQVTKNEQVSGDVRHEELRVEGDEKVVNEDTPGSPRRRKPAA